MESAVAPTETASSTPSAPSGADEGGAAAPARRRRRRGGRGRKRPGTGTATQVDANDAVERRHAPRTHTTEGRRRNDHRLGGRSGRRRSEGDPPVGVVRGPRERARPERRRTGPATRRRLPMPGQPPSRDPLGRPQRNPRLRPPKAAGTTRWPRTGSRARRRPAVAGGAAVAAEGVPRARPGRPRPMAARTRRPRTPRTPRTQRTKEAAPPRTRPRRPVSRSPAVAAVDRVEAPLRAKARARRPRRSAPRGSPPGARPRRPPRRPHRPAPADAGAPPPTRRATPAPPSRRAPAVAGCPGVAAGSPRRWCAALRTSRCSSPSSRSGTRSRCSRTAR